MEQRKQPETLRLRTVMPCLTVNDLQRSLAWYRDIVGFVVSEEFTQDGKLGMVLLKAGAAEFFLTQDDFAQGQRPKGVGFRLYCTTTQDIDRVAAAIQSRGGELLEEPTDRPWGAREFVLVDPDGVKLTISTGKDVDA